VTLLFRHSREGALLSGILSSCLPPGLATGEPEDRLRQASRRQWSTDQVFVDVPPLLIALFDQVDFPSSAPPLEAFLPHDRIGHRLMKLDVTQPVDSIFLAESFEDTSPVLPHAPNDVARDADIKGAIALACQDVDAGSFHRRALYPSNRLLDACLRRHDEDSMSGKRFSTRN